MHPPAPVDSHDQLADAVRTRNLDDVVRLSWRLYYPGLAGMCVRAGIPSDQVEDVIQDVYRRVIEGWPRFHGTAFVEWLFTLTHYQVLSARRSMARALRRVDGMTLDHVPGDAPPVDDELVAGELAVRLAGIRAEWDPVTALLFDGDFADLNSVALAALIHARLGITIRPATLDVRRHRARARVAEELTRLGYNHDRY